MAMYLNGAEKPTADNVNEEVLGAISTTTMLFESVAQIIMLHPSDDAYEVLESALHKIAEVQQMLACVPWAVDSDSETKADD